MFVLPNYPAVLLHHLLERELTSFAFSNNGLASFGDDFWGATTKCFNFAKTDVFNAMLQTSVFSVQLSKSGNMVAENQYVEAYLPYFDTYNKYTDYLKICIKHIEFDFINI